MCSWSCHQAGKSDEHELRLLVGNDLCLGLLIPRSIISSSLSRPEIDYDSRKGLTSE